MHQDLVIIAIQLLMPVLNVITDIITAANQVVILTIGRYVLTKIKETKKLFNEFSMLLTTFHD